MLTHPSNDARILLETSDLARGPLPTALSAYAAQLAAIVDWAHRYLARPHESLGRKGNVCPFVQPSIDRGQFYLAVYPGRPDTPDEVARALLPYRDWFLALAPKGQPTAQLTTILILFPDLTTADLDRIIDGTQESLKSEYVERGLMIGEFHDGPPAKGGLWNPDFRPLRSPVPLLAIRHMVPTDFPFLQGKHDHMMAYLRQFAAQVPTPIREAIVRGLGHPHTGSDDLRIGAS
ncbi:DUF6875 domain-containing protein [Actinokineospora sp.]|uniref:DUF6875 domain-containing protein n=1 Tax=Actinokineospora sp. TaxID=1872133 RepID=UPI004037DC1E